MASTYLTRTFGTATSRTTGTISFWIKTSNFAGGLVNNFSNGSNRAIMYFGGNSVRFYDAVANVEYNANARKIRDCNGWYHFVLMINTTDGTQSDRVRIYINGERQTGLSGSQDYNQNENSYMFNPNTPFCIGVDGKDSSGADFFNGAMSHFYYCDGQAYDASSFGETDATTGEWKIKTNVNVTYGNQGFFILKDGNSVTDQSGNGNNFTVGGGTLTKTEDNPSNVFATLNPLSSVGTFSYGNTEVEYGSGTGYQTTTTTLGMTSGKYYCEAKITFDGNYPGFGIAATNSLQATVLGDDWLGEHSDSYGYYLSGTIYNNGSAIATGQSTFATNDIIGMALDLDSAQNTLKFYKNGSLINTTNITTNSNGWFFGTSHVNNKTSARSKFNFGNGYFRSDAVSSAGTNASNIGIFEYDVPTGYTALSTKGLNL